VTPQTEHEWKTITATVLTHNWPKEFNKMLPIEMEIWKTSLMMYPADWCNIVIIDWKRKSPYFPKVADLIKGLREYRRENEPGYGHYQQPTCEHSMMDDVEKVAAALMELGEEKVQEIGDLLVAEDPRLNYWRVRGWKVFSDRIWKHAKMKGLVKIEPRKDTETV
jgi:hypothetical protein